MREHRCECGAVYHREEERYQSPGRGKHECIVCQRELEAWDGYVVPSYRLVKLPDAGNAD